MNCWQRKVTHEILFGDPDDTLGCQAEAKRAGMKIPKNPCEGCRHYDKSYECEMRGDRKCYDPSER